MSRYLQLRRRRWYATLDIPKDVRPMFGGKPRFVRSLKTESRTVAEHRVRLVVAEWKAEIHEARTGDAGPKNELRETAENWRDTLDNAASEEERRALEMAMIDQAELIEEQRPGAGIAVFKLASRQWVETSEMVEEWLSTLDNEPKTLDMKRSDLKRFASRFSVTRNVERKKIQAWVHELQHTDGLKLATIRRIISAARGYWEYLQRLDIVADNIDPFYKAVPKSKKGTKATQSDKRREFTPTQVVSLVSAAIERDDYNLGLLIWLGMWTGCRIEELCALRTSEVTEDRFTIIDAKSEAGLREVPIHSRLDPALRHMCATSTDGFVLSGLTNNKYNDRSNAIGKRFGRLKTALGFDKTYVFHSLRKTVATQLDAAGIPETVSARILGHELKTMTYGLYSGGAPFEVKKEALEALTYPITDGSHEKLWEGRRDA